MYLYIHLTRKLPVANILIYSPDRQLPVATVLYIHLTRQLPVANVLIYSPDQTVTCS